MKHIFTKENIITFFLVTVACTIAVVFGAPLAADFKAKLTPATSTGTGGA